MAFDQDTKHLRDVVEKLDPSFQTVPEDKITACFKDISTVAVSGSRDAFLLSAMRLLALPGNGHTRLIPNAAISILPFRFVTLGADVYLTKTIPAFSHLTGDCLQAVNDVEIGDLEQALGPYLAGTAQRRRVIGPLLFCWPAALAHVSVHMPDKKLTYQFKKSAGRFVTVTVDPTIRVAANSLYPVSEHGGS
jgi:hypothetical protein